MIPSEFPSNLHQVKSVVTAAKKGFVLADGTFIEADVIIYCTGNVDVTQFLGLVSRPRDVDINENGERLTDFLDSFTAAMLHLYLSSTAIFMLTALLNLATACLPPPAASLHKTFYFFSSLFCPST